MDNYGFVNSSIKQIPRNLLTFIFETILHLWKKKKRSIAVLQFYFRKQF